MALDTLSKAIGDTIDLSVGDIIAKYGGDKKAIGLAAQKGEIDPTKAVMAGMAVDRVVASAMKPQTTTVAEDVLTPPQQMPQQMGLPTPQQPAQMPPQRTGLNQVPIPQRGFAGGGIIGMQAGGTGNDALRDALNQMTYQERVQFQRTGRLPDRLRMSLPENQPSFLNALKAKEDQRNSLINNIPMEPSAPPPALPTAAPPSGNLAAGVNPNYSDRLYESPIESLPDEEAPPAQTSGLAAAAGQAPARKSPKDYAARANEMYDTLYGDYAKGMTKPDREAMGLDTLDFLERSGVNLNLAKEQAARLAEEKEELKGDRKEATNLRLIEAGLGILGGESPYAFVNIGKGATPAVKGLAQDIKDIKKSQRELDRARDQLEVAQNQMNMGVASMTQNRFDKKSEAYDKAQMDMQKSKGDLAKTLMTIDSSRDIVERQMSKKSAYELARADWVAGGGRPEDFAAAYIGQQKAGAMTADEFDAFAVEQWNKLKGTEKRALKKQGIETLQDYKRYLERNRRRGSLLEPSGGTTTPLSNNPLNLDPALLNANR